VADLLAETGAAKGATAAQVAVGWLLAKKPWIVPIPGTRKLRRLEENLASADVALTEADLEELTRSAASIAIKGGRGTGHERYL
jgi:aryl-alcohol dehydrogenase-like predicted oxidoreductase